MAAVKVQHEGQEIEVELPDGYVGPDDLKDQYVPKTYFETEMQRRIEGAKRSAAQAARAALESDEAFLQEVAQKHGKSGADLDRARKAWEEEHLSPVKSQLEGIQKRLVGASVAQAAQKYFKEDFLNSPFTNLEAAFGQHFEYDADLGYVVAKGPDGNRLASSGSDLAKKPYADADEFFARLVRDEKYKPYARVDVNDSSSRYNGGGKTPPASKKRSEMSEAERLAYIKDHGREAYTKLPL